MSFYISKIDQQLTTTFYQQAYDSIKMGAGMNAGRARDQRKQTVTNVEALIAANVATSKSKGPPSVVITARGSSLGACVHKEDVVSEDASGMSVRDMDIDDVASSSTPAQDSLAQTLKNEIELLKRQKCNSALGNANLKEQLDFKKMECERYEQQLTQKEEIIAQRDMSIEQIRGEYDAERSKSEKQAKQIRELKELRAKLHDTIDVANIDKVSAQEKYQAEVEIRATLEADIHKLEEERVGLKKELESMKENQNKFAKKARSQMKVYETVNTRLIAQCNQLVDQNGRRRTHVPAEDESKVIDAFYALQNGIRCWSLDVQDTVKTELQDAELEFSKFPLADRKMRMTLHAEEAQFLIAYVWEWLMKSVFGSEQCKEQNVGRLFDLWTDEETARHLEFLERRIFSTQKSGVAHEWRSFTVQCLAESTELEESPRTASVMDEVSSWLLAVSNLDAKESEAAIAKLLEDFQKDVVIPAILFSKLLRQRFTPILLKTPEPCQDAIENGYRAGFEHGAKKPGVQIVISPELCKENMDLTKGDGSKLEILVEAERFRKLVTKDSRREISIRKVSAEDQEMSDA